jgi:hypothetical protein
MKWQNQWSNGPFKYQLKSGGDSLHDLRLIMPQEGYDARVNSSKDVLSQLLARVSSPPPEFDEKFIMDALVSVESYDRAMAFLLQFHVVLEVAENRLGKPLNQIFRGLTSSYVISDAQMFKRDAGVRAHVKFGDKRSELFVCHSQQRRELPLSLDQHCRICSFEQGQQKDGVWSVSQLQLALLNKYRECLSCRDGECDSRQCWAEKKAPILDKLAQRLSPSDSV